MPKKATTPKLQPFSMRFTPEMKTLLESLAKAENRSMSNYLETKLPVWLQAEAAKIKGAGK